MYRIIIGSWMIRYPLGGNLSWALQYILGIYDLGHEVYFVEQAGYNNACYDVEKKVMTNDCGYGIKVVSELFKRYGLENNWCYVDYNGNYYGLNKQQVTEIFKTADLFIDSGSHGAWSEEASTSKLSILIDGEPAFTQMKWANNLSAGKPIPLYDHYFTNGKNIGEAGNPAPTLNIQWKHFYSPVKTDIFKVTPSAKESPYSTIMNWQSHSPISYNGKVYGQKDLEFEKFMNLPCLSQQYFEVAVSGKGVPINRLQENNWVINDAQKVTLTFDSFRNYISYCRGEFSVCKNVFIENQTGWFSDKSAAYLASGRPVILQDTGFSKHLPVGKGLFAVNTAEEARDAILTIEADYDLHSKSAREIAYEYLEASASMKALLHKVGL